MQSKKWILALLATTLVIPSLSHAVWETPYRWSTSNEIHAIQQTSDGGHILTGRFWALGIGQYDLWVLRLNRDGTIAWQMAYGGSLWDEGYAVRETSDGGFIVAGATQSFGEGDDDFWVLKLNRDGTIAWQKAYGGKGPDRAKTVHETTDGGYFVSGVTGSFGAGKYDFWALKLSSDGTVVWQRTYGGRGSEEAVYDSMPVQQTSDGGFILAGATRSFGQGDDDFWVLKLRLDGTIVWQKTCGSGADEYPTSIQEGPDGGYIVKGASIFSLYDDWTLSFDKNGQLGDLKGLENTEVRTKDTSIAPQVTEAKTMDSSANVLNTSDRMEGTHETRPESPPLE